MDAIDEEIRYLKAEMYVITPSRIPEKIKKTASSITVVTDRQIRQMGARNLVDVLWAELVLICAVLELSAGIDEKNIRSGLALIEKQNCSGDTRPIE